MSVADSCADDEKKPDRQRTRPDGDRPRAVLAVATMGVGALGYFGMLDLLTSEYGNLPPSVLIYFFFFCFLPLATVNGSRFDTWPRAGLVVALGLSTVAVSGLAVAVGAVVLPGGHLASIAGIAIAWLIAGGTIEFSRQRWSTAESLSDPAQNVDFRLMRRHICRVAIVLALMVGFTALGFAVADAQVYCPWGGLVGTVAGLGPSLLIASQRTAGFAAWSITLLGSVISFAVVSAGMIVGSWAYDAWDLAGHYTTGMAVLIAPLIPGSIVTWLFYLQISRTASMDAESQKPAENG